MIPDSVTEIGESAFNECKGLKEVRVGKGVELLSKQVFYYCRDLERVTLSRGVSMIDWAVFYGCTSLKEIVLPDTITLIGYQAFIGTGLTKVYYGGTRTQWNRIEFIKPYPFGGDGNGPLHAAQFVWEWKDPEEQRPTVSGTVIGGKDLTVTVAGESAEVNADGSFSGSIPEGAFDVVVKQAGCLTYTVKNVRAENGNITLPEITLVQGDVNGDDMINIMDMGVFRQNFGKVGANILNALADVNGDSMVNIMDMGIFRSNFGKTAAKDCTVTF